MKETTIMITIGGKLFFFLTTEYHLEVSCVMTENMGTISGQASLFHILGNFDLESSCC